MKKYPLFLCTLCLLLIFSCKKSNSGNESAATAANSYLSSVVAYSPQQRVVDFFSYDSAHRLDSFVQTVYDTSSGIPEYGTFQVQFIYQGANVYPSYYNLYDTLQGNYGDYHLLSYDGQGRISKDTSLSGSGYVDYFTYPNNNIASTVLWEGTADNNQIDTLFITNGNISAEHIYTSDIPGQPDVSQGAVNYGFSSIPNPGYHADISNSIGPLLTIMGIDGYGSAADFISKNALDQLSGIGSGLPTGTTITYTLTKDSKGRLATMSASYGGVTGKDVYSYY
jgi:hypothetical protein